MLYFKTLVPKADSSQAVGQGVFIKQPRSSLLPLNRIKRDLIPSHMRRVGDQVEYVESWKSIVSRSILYRACQSSNTLSGTAVCVNDTSAGKLSILGFQSFFQEHASSAPKGSLQGKELYEDLREGNVAFYGAFEVPEELKQSEIV